MTSLSESRLAPFFLALAASLAGCAAPVDEPAELHAAESRQAIVPAVGQRPLLVVIVEGTPARPIAHTDAYYRQLLFGPAFPNLADYFAEVSNDNMTIVEAGLIRTAGPSAADAAAFNARAQIPATEPDVAQQGRYATLQMAEDAGFDFSRWDADGNGVVNAHELAILQIDTIDPTGGQNGWIGCTNHSGVSVCPSVALSGDQGELMLYAHELLHQIIDAAHVYGADGTLSVGMTPMSNTRSVDATFVYYLDPLHRLFTGWESRFVPMLAQSSGSATLYPVSDPHPEGDRGIVLSRPGAALNEYLFIEYRRRLASSYDRDVRQTGIYVWNVQLNANNDAPAFVPSLAVPGGQEEALFVIAPENCVAGAGSAGSRGVVRPLAMGGSYRFRWLDGTDTGQLFSVSGDPGNFGHRVVSWAPSSASPVCP